MKIIDTQLKWLEDSNETLLITKYEDDSISCENLASEEAALWTAQHKY